MGTIADVNAASTTITMRGNYEITATFVEGRLIRSWYDLDAIRNNLDDSYILMNDLDATTAGYEELASPTANGGQGWQPIAVFSGSFDGRGYEITDLLVNRPDNDYRGLFGQLSGLGVIKNVNIVNVTVTGHWIVGGLAGSTQATVSNSYSTGNVVGNDFFVGGQVGDNDGTLSNSYSTATVSGDVTVGGLVGNSNGVVSNSYSAASATGNEDVGGLVGYNKATVRESCFVGRVVGYRWIGGLVGYNYDGSTVINSYSTGSVTGENDVGGLVGGSRGIVSNCCSAGNVTGDDRVGGLVGANFGTVSASYCTGTVTGTWSAGGLVGASYHDIVRNSFWDVETSGQAASAGGTGKTTVAMKNIVTFSDAGWHIIAVAPHEKNPTYTWNIVDGETYPFLSWQPAS